MNLFEEMLDKNRMYTSDELRRLFWRLAKKLHPDANSVQANHEMFIRLKSDYDKALAGMGAGKGRMKADAAFGMPPARGGPSREICVDLFLDLLASNFPMDNGIRRSKVYLARIERMNTEFAKFGPEYRDVFLAFEKEMCVLKGGKTVANHEFNVVKLYFYRYSDFTYMKTKNNRNYLVMGYRLVHDILKGTHMTNSIFFLGWLVGDIVKTDA